MLLNYSETQGQLAQSARELLSRGTPPGGPDDWKSLWADLDSLGWFDVLSARDGGLDIEHVSVLLFEAGRAGAIAPYYQTVVSQGVFRPGLDSVQGRDDRAGRPPECSVLLSDADADGHYLHESGRAGRALVVSGGPYLVEWGHQAESFVAPVTMRDHAVRMCVVRPDDEGVSVDEALSMDDEPLAWVSCQDVRLEPDRVAGTACTDEAVADAAALARLLRAVEMAGGTQAVLEMTVRYVCQREQFGRPLAVLQAVQHLCADMRIRADASLLAVSVALDCAPRGALFRERAAVATWIAGRSYEQLTQSAAQLHGAMGYMLEYPLNRYFRRAKAQRIRLGRSIDQLERIAAHKFGPADRSGVRRHD